MVNATSVHSTTSVLTPDPDIVFVGGGPVGLWTAIQTKLLTNKTIVVLEKYQEYKRGDIRLNLDASSFSGIPKYLPLQNLVKKWGNRAVPIKEMETALTECANNLGIRILTGKQADLEKLQEEFPTARLFVGADGARSVVRKTIFNDEYKFNTPLQYLIQVQYLIETPEANKDLDSLKSFVDTYKKQKFAGHLITESIRPQENGLYSQVTLRIFIDEATYKKMADATFSNPYYFENDLNKVPPVLQETLIKWWGSQEDHDIVTDVEKVNKITVIPLASYASKEVYKVVEKEDDADDQVVYALVGDASQAYPFFRAINNGLLLGTKLAKCINQAFANLKKAEEKGVNKQQKAKAFAASFSAYSSYSTKRAYIERIKALVKNFFIDLSSLWIKVSGNVPWQSVKLKTKDQHEFYVRGAQIWENISGLPAPQFEDKSYLRKFKLLKKPKILAT